MTNPTQKQIDDAIVRAHQLRAEHVANLFSRLWKFITFRK